jgi:hypothetical protein
LKSDLGPEELGGVVADGKAISYRMKEPVARHAFTRATYTNISADHFTWRGDRSNDGKTWEQFMVIELYRRRKITTQANPLRDPPRLRADAHRVRTIAPVQSGVDATNAAH